MLAAMEQTPETSRDLVEDFLTTGRTGRRNAMADILGEHANTGSGDISQHMEHMGLSADQPGAPGTSGSAAASSGPAPSSSSVPGPGSAAAAGAGGGGGGTAEKGAAAGS